MYTAQDRRRGGNPTPYKSLIARGFRHVSGILQRNNHYQQEHFQYRCSAPPLPLTTALFHLPPPPPSARPFPRRQHSFWLGFIDSRRCRQKGASLVEVSKTTMYRNEKGNSATKGKRTRQQTSHLQVSSSHHPRLFPLHPLPPQSPARRRLRPPPRAPPLPGVHGVLRHGCGVLPRREAGHRHPV